MPSERTLAFCFSSADFPSVTLFINVDIHTGGDQLIGNTGWGACRCLVVRGSQALITEVRATWDWKRSIGRSEHKFQFTSHFPVGAPLTETELTVVLYDNKPTPDSVIWESQKAEDARDLGSCEYVPITLDVPREVSLPKSIEIHLAGATGPSTLDVAG